MPYSPDAEFISKGAWPAPKRSVVRKTDVKNVEEEAGQHRWLDTRHLTWCLLWNGRLIHPRVGMQAEISRA
jgi:hypothetical protein